MNKLKWNNLDKPLSAPILKVVENVLKFEKMTPVQVSKNQDEILSIHEFVKFNLNLYSERNDSTAVVLQGCCC